MAVGLPRVSATPGTPVTQAIFSLCCPLIDRRRAARSLFEIGRLFSLFSCLSFARLFLLLLLLMSGNVHPNLGPVISCSMCAGNVTWRGRLVQCCTCSKWIYLRCSFLSLSRFKILRSSHSWSCPPCCVPASPGYPTPTNIATFSSDTSSLYISTAYLAHLAPSANAALPPTLVFKPPTLLTPLSYLLTLYPHHGFMFLVVFYTSCFLFPSESLRVLQWNAGGLRARSTKLLHFISSHLIDLICIQESLTHLPLSGSLDSVLCDLIAPTPILAFFLRIPRTLAVASSFLSGRAYPSLSFLPPPSLLLTLTLIM